MSYSRAAEYGEYARHCIRFAHRSTPQLRPQLIASAVEWARKSVAEENNNQTERTECPPAQVADDLQTLMNMGIGTAPDRFLFAGQDCYFENLGPDRLDPSPSS